MSSSERQPKKARTVAASPAILNTDELEILKEFQSVSIAFYLSISSSLPTAIQLIHYEVAPENWATFLSKDFKRVILSIMLIILQKAIEFELILGEGILGE